MLELASPSPATTSEIAAALAGVARRGDLIVLAGDMGAGKTAFAQGFGKALGVTDPITSPTFTLVHSYEIGSGRHAMTLHHADLYRLDRMAEVADLALGELLEADGIVLVEWGDVVAAAFGDHLEVRLVADDSDDLEFRAIAVTGVGPQWAKRWEQVVEALAPWTVAEDDWC
ncbi:MAG: tRNA (adenosine(37)-N6)-threonylcarbamoyltransferase complex ATPase subunit type 1 TsaE [Ilumatobacteraceae bacterium]